MPSDAETENATTPEDDDVLEAMGDGGDAYAYAYADPPPAYDCIGPGPVSFHDCMSSSAHGHGHGHAARQYRVRDTRRRRSFGIGGAGNIRAFSSPQLLCFCPLLSRPSSSRSGTTKESGIVVLVPPASLRAAPEPRLPLVAAAAEHAPGPGDAAAATEQRRGSSSGANDLRDRLVDGVKTLLSGVGSVMGSVGHEQR